MIARHRTPWRRQHIRLLVRLWDKDFNYVDTITDDDKLEPWGRYLKRIWRRLTPAWLIALLPLLLIPLAAVGA